MGATGILIGAAALLLLMATPPRTATAADLPMVFVGDAAIAEPADRSGTVFVEVPVTLTRGTGPVTVNWRTVAGSATTSDFVDRSSSLTIPAGAVGASIGIEVRLNRTQEPMESFTVELTSAFGTLIADGTGEVTIHPTPTGLTLGDVTATEPDAGTTLVSVAAVLDAPARKAVTFGWELRSATGTVGSDVEPASGTATIAKGRVGTLLAVGLNGDIGVEPDEHVEVVITSITNSPLADGVGRINIRNTDEPPPPADPFGWQPPTGSIPASGTVLYVESPTGDYIGQGQTYRYTNVDSVLTLGYSGYYIDFTVRGDESWSLRVAEPTTVGTFSTGYWENVGRHPFANPGLSFSGEGRGCNTLLGRFIVDEVSFTADLVQTLTLRFEQRCEGSGPPLVGYLRYDRADTSQPPPPGDPADFVWSPPAGEVPATGNYLYFQSQPGDYIGQGRTELYTEADSTFVPDWSTTLVQLFVDDPATAGFDWSLDLDGRYNQPRLTVGLYEDVERYPFHNTAKGGLDFSGEHRGCNELEGAFAIDEITWEGTELVSFAARFEQRCEGVMPPLYGAVRWQRP